MSAPVPVRLFGGPFDGDKAAGTPPLPEVMYVWACKTPARQCPSNGVHWNHVPMTSACEVYRLGEVDENGVQVYVHEDLGLQSQVSAAELDRAA